MTKPKSTTDRAGAKRKPDAQRRYRRLMERFGFKAAIDMPPGGAPVNVSRLAPDTSYGAPEFVMRGYYLDQPFACCACQTQEIWTARQQKWWYETAKGAVWSEARRCRPCRARERQRIARLRRARAASPGRDADLKA